MREYHRQSTRLRGFSYTQPGYYFVTICTQNRAKLFGSHGAITWDCQSKNPSVHPSRAITWDCPYDMVESWWNKIPSKFPNTRLDAFVIMPDHIHGIIEITVRADPCVRPYSDIRRIVQWFKTMTTNEYIRGVKSGMYPPFEKRMWQRNYWERIIRDDRELQYVRQYIVDNPKNWNSDDTP